MVMGLAPWVLVEGLFSSLMAPCNDLKLGWGVDSLDKSSDCTFIISVSVASF